MRAFDRIDPTGPETPVVVEIPHAGIDLAATYLEPLAAPARAIARDADLYVDALYEDAVAEGATVLVARASRYVIDLNRAEGDVDSDVVEGGRADVRLHHGLIWRTTSDGERALTRRLSQLELEERLESVWRPYHRELARIVEGKRERFGIAVILAAHSMPSYERGARPVPGSREAGDALERRADVVPGTRGRRSAGAQFIDVVEAHALRRGWTVRHDDPYAGGYTTQHYGRPSDRVHAIQVELARRLYLNEETLRPAHDFEHVRGWCRALVALLGGAAKSSAGPRSTCP